VGWTGWGNVPAHWAVAPLKRGYDVRLGKMLQPDRASDDDILAPYLRAANIQWGGVELENLKSMWFSTRERELLALKKGDLLVSEGGDVGRSSLWQEELEGCYFQNSVNRVRSRGTDRTDYLHYWMATIKSKGYVDVLCNKSTIAHFTAEKVEAVPTPYPSPEEQRQIAAFLDYETARIDALIAEQEKLLALLAEKRQATISHAVTRGLDPNVPMKDSGIAWLGEVPAHWDVVTLRRVVETFEQGWSPDCESRTPELGEWGVLKAGCVNGGVFSATESKALPVALSPRPELEVRGGDVLMSRASGSPKLIGSVALLEEVPPRLMLSDKVFRLRLSSTVIPRFFALSMGSTLMRRQIEVAIGGAEGLANNLPQSSIKQFWLALPPRSEQERIVASLGAETLHLDKMRGAAEQAVVLLKERRSALISAAVTGQVDVRGLVEMEAG
jgi:Restriction endonuclease S subunits